MANEQENKIDVLKDHMAKLESEKGQFENHVKEFRKNLKQYDDDFSLGIDEEKKGLIDELSSIITNINEYRDKLLKFKNELGADRNNFEGNLDGLLGKLEEGISNLDNQLRTLTSKQEEEIANIYKQMSENVSSGLKNIFSSQYQQIETFENQISKRLGDIQRDIVSTVESENANIVEMASGISSSFLESLDDFKSRIRQLGDTKENELDNVFANTVRESVARLEIAKEDLLAGIDGLKNRLEEHLVQQKAVFEESQKQVLSLIDAGKNDAKARIDKGIDRYWEEFKKYQIEQSQKVANIKENVYQSFMSALDTNESLQSNELTDFENNMKNGFKQLENQILGSLSRISTDFNKKRAATTETFTKTFEDWSTGIDTSLAQFGSKTKSKLQETTSDLNTSLMSFFDNSQKGLSDTLSKHSGTLGDLQESINQLFRQIQAGQEKNIEITLVDVQKALMSKQSELITTVASIDPSAGTVVDNQRENIKTKNQEIKIASSAAFDDLKNQMHSIAQDGIASIQNIVRETRDNLDRAIKSSEDSSQSLVDRIERDHKDSIHQYRTNVGQKFDNQTNSIDQFRSSLKERFEEFFSESQRTSDSIITQLEDDANSLTDSRRSMGIKVDGVKDSVSSSTNSLKTNIEENTKKISGSVKQISSSSKDIIKKV
ncbi:MAG: hypothetical protein ACW97P_07265 [Candidatus Hodarchaeales archaeon]|jgi:hypothetical protein